MLHIAIVGSGPAGYYTAEGLLKSLGDGVRIDILDRLPTPFGLIRAGVAPDHQSIKAVTRRYEATAMEDNVRFVGNIEIGEGVCIDELRTLYDAVIIATGAPSDRRLGIPGEDLPGVIGSAAFVGWYNGHPDFAGVAPPLDTESVVIVGNGNVALDVARILAKTPAELEGSDTADHAARALATSGLRQIHIVGRRGPHQVSFTPKELGEMGKLSRAAAHLDPADLPPGEEDAGLDPGQRKVLGLLREFAAAATREAHIHVHFVHFARPVAVEGDGRVEGLRIERTQLSTDGRVEGTGEERVIPCGMIVPCIGYRTNPIPGVPYDAELGRFANVDGVIAPGLYCVGWSQRGPTGTIGTNRPDGFAIAERIAADPPPGGKIGGDGLDRLIAERDLYAVTFRDWQKIDAAEIARARLGAPREKFVHRSAMLAAAKAP